MVALRLLGLFITCLPCVMLVRTARTATSSIRRLRHQALLVGLQAKPKIQPSKALAAMLPAFNPTTAFRPHPLQPQRALRGPARIRSKLMLREAGSVNPPHSDSANSARAPSLKRGTKLSVGVIGGGIAGLACAQALKESGNFEPVVFDTGRLRPGGRCSSRFPGDVEEGQGDLFTGNVLRDEVLDHAAQIITSSISKAFGEQVSKWENEGVLTRFPEGSVVEIVPKMGGNGNDSIFDLRPLNMGDDEASVDMFHGTGGMGSIPVAIATDADLQVEQDVWVSPSSGVKYRGKEGKPMWRVRANGETLGEFDRLVIAHNGKCADRLMSKTPATRLHSLLRTKFDSRVPANGGKRMTLNSIYSLVFAVDSRKSPIAQVLPSHVITALVKNEPALRLISCNSKKYGPNSSPIETYTVLSSAKFAKKYKAPQEYMPDEIREKVTNLLLLAVERALGLAESSLSGDGAILDSRLQLWGAAVPLNVWAGESPGFLYDDEFGVGACGDWLLEPSAEGAWESGKRLAAWMDEAAFQNADSAASASIGLPPNGKFVRSEASSEAGIGSLGTSTPDVAQ